MNLRLKYFLPVGIFITLVVVFYVGLYRDPTLVPSPFIGKAAPAFDLPTLYDPQQRITHEVFKGQISLFNVWASWCPGCAQEHAMLNAIAEEGEVPIYGLNWKDEGQPARKCCKNAATLTQKSRLIAITIPALNGVFTGHRKLF